jgi:hypothetical protein
MRMIDEVRDCKWTRGKHEKNLEESFVSFQTACHGQSLGISFCQSLVLPLGLREKIQKFVQSTCTSRTA